MATFHPQPGGLGLTIREMVLHDREAVRGLLLESPTFSEEEVRVALEVLDAGLAGGLEGDYPLFAVEIDACVCGYVCIGRTPMTQSTWHLYWICIHPRAQRRGIGQALETRIEQFIRARGGERIVLETSGRPDYAPARRFYEKAGYCVAGRIRDYYKPGDDCVFYTKLL
ncbi:MAG: GCN5-related N-acetyltransferase [Bryobacterales bacterium]|nr:GCN5-related N-acetyltransferase [Bryobacterales bacterium]